MHLHHPTDNPPPASLPLLLSLMAKTSRDPFSPQPLSVPMKKKGGGQKTVSKADGSVGTPKKKTTSATQKNNNPPE